MRNLQSLNHLIYNKLFFSFLEKKSRIFAYYEQSILSEQYFRKGIYP